MSASELRRRRIAVAATAVTGGGLLGASLSTKPNSPRSLLTNSVAAVGTLGGIASRHDGGGETRTNEGARSLVRPAAIGVGAFAGFYAAARAARLVPLLDDALHSVMAYSHEGADALVLGTALVNGLAEEIFFRGAVYDAVGSRNQVAATTAVYAAVTAATRNPALVAASGVMGWLFATQRRETGGILNSVVTHVTWSTLMLRYVPPLFDTRPRRAGS